MKKEIKKQYKQELLYRFYGKVLSWVSVIALFCIGFVEGLTGMLFNLTAMAGLGLLLLIGLSVYFFYKGRHYEVEKDNIGIYLAVILFALYILTTYDIVLALIVGTIQYVIGRGVSLGRK